MLWMVRSSTEVWGIKMRALWTNIRVSCSGLRFWLGIAGFAIMGTAAVFEELVIAFRSRELLEAGFHLQLMGKMLSSPTMMLAVPVTAVIPSSARFTESLHSGFVRQSLPRSSYLRYTLGQVLACGLSGGIVMILGAGMCFILALLVFLPMEMAGAVPIQEGIVLLKTVGLFFLSGALWSLVGLWLSLATDSQYMAYAAPFILFYLLIILKERYFPSWFMFFPHDWLAASELWPLGMGGAALWVGEWILIVGVMCFMVGERRVRQL